jgi:hypothetical protein
MASAQLWLELLAVGKAVLDSTKAAIDFAATVQKYRRDPDTIGEAQHVSARFSTHSDAEIDALAKRMASCRSRFIDEGSGQQKSRMHLQRSDWRCGGNGGQLPFVDDWQNMYSQLKCARNTAQ